MWWTIFWFVGGIMLGGVAIGLLALVIVGKAAEAVIKVIWR